MSEQASEPSLVIEVDSKPKIKFYLLTYKLLQLAERIWLRSAGWKQYEDGHWVLPDWHPKRHQSQAYDVDHAVNSQKHYLMKNRFRFKDRYELGPLFEFKSLYREVKLQLIFAPLICVSAGTAAGSEIGSWFFYVALFAAVALVSMSILSGRRAVALMKLEFVERALRDQR